MTNTPKTYPTSFTVTPENFVEALKMLQDLLHGDLVAFEYGNIRWDMGWVPYTEDKDYAETRYGSTVVESLQIALTEKLAEYHAAEVKRITMAKNDQLHREKEALQLEQQYAALSKTISASKSLTEKVASLTAMKNFLQGNVSFKNRFNLVISSQTPETQEIWAAMGPI